MELAIEVTGLVKRYGDFTAVNGISFSVKQNTCFGILGPNGAGKTTTLEMIEGLKTYSAGKIKVLGLDLDTQLAAVQSRIGVQLQENNYFDFLDVTQLLTFFMELRQASAPNQKSLSLDELLAMVSLTDKARAKVAELSGGQKQRFSIALSMVGDPEILFLDEPTTALDPQSRHHIWDFIKELKEKRKKTIVLTTHFMEEAERLCDELIIMDHGKIISSGEPRTLIRNLNKYHRVHIRAAAGSLTTQYLLGLPGVSECKWDNDSSEFVLVTEAPVRTVKELFSFAETNNIGIEDFHTHKASLEDVFLSETGKVLRD